MSRKIYFGGSISGGRDDADLYARLIEQLRQYGKVLTEHVGNYSVEEDLVAEVTQPSLGVGYEIGRAVDLKKTILCLFRPQSGKELSAMFRGAENGSTFIVKDYKESEAPTIFKQFFKRRIIKLFSLTVIS